MIKTCVLKHSKSEKLLQRYDRLAKLINVHTNRYDVVDFLLSATNVYEGLLRHDLNLKAPFLKHISAKAK